MCRVLDECTDGRYTSRTTCNNTEQNTESGTIVQYSLNQTPRKDHMVFLKSFIGKRNLIGLSNNVVESLLPLCHLQCVLFCCSNQSLCAIAIISSLKALVCSSYLF